MTEIINIDHELAARKVIEATDKSGINLIAFALKEKKDTEVLKDLKVKFRQRDAIAILKVWQKKPQKIVTLLQSSLNKEKINAEKGENKEKPYIGQILVSKFGYDCTLVKFYQAVKVTKCFVYIRQLKKEMAENVDGYGQQATYRPIKNDFLDDKPMRKRIKQDRYDPFFVAISSYEYAKPWSGLDQYEDSLD